MFRFLCAVALLGSDCAPSTLGGNPRADGYHHNLLPIHLRSTSQETQFVSADWRLEDWPRLRVRGRLDLCPISLGEVVQFGPPIWLPSPRPR